MMFQNVIFFSQLKLKGIEKNLKFNIFVGFNRKIINFLVIISWYLKVEIEKKYKFIYVGFLLYEREIKMKLLEVQ